MKAQYTLDLPSPENRLPRQVVRPKCPPRVAPVAGESQYQTPLWTVWKTETKLKAGGYCPSCGAPDVHPNSMEAHHIKYGYIRDGKGKWRKDIFAIDKDTDLVPLCRLCHEDRHRIIDQEIDPIFLPAENTDLLECAELIKKIAPVRPDGGHVRYLNGVLRHHLENIATEQEQELALKMASSGALAGGDHVE